MGGSNKNEWGKGVPRRWHDKCKGLLSRDKLLESKENLGSHYAQSGMIKVKSVRLRLGRQWGNRLEAH